MQNFAKNGRLCWRGSRVYLPPGFRSQQVRGDHSKRKVPYVNVSAKNGCCANHKHRAFPMTCKKWVLPPYHGTWQKNLFRMNLGQHLQLHRREWPSAQFHHCDPGTGWLGVACPRHGYVQGPTKNVGMDQPWILVELPHNPCQASIVVHI